MDNKKLLGQIGILIEEKLEPIKQQLDNVEMKVEVVNGTVSQLSKKNRSITRRNHRCSI